MGFSFKHGRFFDCPCQLLARDSETMTPKRDRINIKVYGPSAEPEAARRDAARADDPILALARLIGRQMAREQFERQLARERRSQKIRPASDNA